MSNRGPYPKQGSASSIAKHPDYDAAALEENEALHEQAEAEARAKSEEIRPDDLNDEERKVWDRICPQLFYENRMKALYSDLLAEFCRAVVRLASNRAVIDEHGGPTFKTTGRHGDQWKSRPEVAQMNDDFRKLTQLAAHFGLSPATEMRYAAKQGELFGPNEFDDL